MLSLCKKQLRLFKTHKKKPAKKSKKFVYSALASAAAKPPSGQLTQKRTIGYSGLRRGRRGSCSHKIGKLIRVGCCEWGFCLSDYHTTKTSSKVDRSTQRKMQPKPKGKKALRLSFQKSI